MRIARKLITPVVAAVVLVGSAAYAQDAVVELVEQNDGTWRNTGLFWWHYDAEAGQLEWGDAGCANSTVDTTPDTEALPEGTDVHFDSNCRTIDIAAPDEKVGEDEEPADPDDPTESVEEPTHGALVSAFAKDVKLADEEGQLEELAAAAGVDRVNRGSLISQLAKLFKTDKGDTGSDTEVTGADDGPEKPEKAPKVDHPNQGNGKSDR